MAAGNSCHNCKLESLIDVLNMAKVKDCRVKFFIVDLVGTLNLKVNVTHLFNFQR
jgi:hypothetical protein